MRRIYLDRGVGRKTYFFDGNLCLGSGTRLLVDFGEVDRKQL